MIKKMKPDFIIIVSIIFAVITLVIAILSVSIFAGTIYFSDRFFYSFLMLYFAVLLGYFMARYLHHKSRR